MDKTNVNISKQVFNPKFLPLLDDTHRYNVIFGGSSSGKSFFIAQRIVYRLLKDPFRNTLVVRKVGRTNRDSTFAEIKKIIYAWEVSHLFKITDLRISRPGGGTILFDGLDSVEKQKSKAFDRGILNDVWIEEASEVTQNDFSQLDLRLRGQSDILFQVTLSFNPVSALSWIKKYFFDSQVDDCVKLHSTYLDNKFLSGTEAVILNNLKKTDSILYKIYALGEWGVLGNLIYTNYAIHEFEDNFDRHYNGLDWGYNHPTAGLKMAFREDEIYIIDMFYVSGYDNPELMRRAKRLWDKRHEYITADSAEPRTIEEWKKAGWMIAGARKGPDSVRNGIGWCRAHKIHIHPRCQDFINEIQGYSYRKDKDGNVLDEPVPFRDDAMASMRYGFEQLMDLKEYRVLAV